MRGGCDFCIRIENGLWVGRLGWLGVEGVRGLRLIRAFHAKEIAMKGSIMFLMSVLAVISIGCESKEEKAPMVPAKPAPAAPTPAAPMMSAPTTMPAGASGVSSDAQAKL